MIMKEIIKNIARDHLAQTEKIINDAIKAFTKSSDWDMRRGMWRKHKPSGIEVFHFDDTPLVEFQPIKFGTAVKSGTIAICATQEYKLLHNEPHKDDDERN